MMESEPLNPSTTTGSAGQAFREAALAALDAEEAYFDRRRLKAAKRAGALAQAGRNAMDDPETRAVYWEGATYAQAANRLRSLRRRLARLPHSPTPTAPGGTG